MQAYLHATLDDASRLIPHAQFYHQPGTGCLPGLSAPGHCRPWPAHPPLHGQRQDLSLASSWRASPLPSASWSSTRHRISPKAVERSNATSVLLLSTTEERLCGHCSYVALGQISPVVCGFGPDEGHIRRRGQSFRKNAMMPLSSFHLRPGFTPLTSQCARALAFISRSTSA